MYMYSEVFFVVVGEVYSEFCLEKNPRVPPVNHDWFHVEEEMIDLMMVSLAWSFSPCILSHVHADSPGIPVSATSKELFRGFSYVDPSLMDYAPSTSQATTVHMSTVSGEQASEWVRECERGGGVEGWVCWMKDCMSIGE